MVNLFYENRILQSLKKVTKMKKAIYLYGAGKRGKHALRVLKEHCRNQIRVLGIIDKRKDMDVDGYRVVQADDIELIEKDVDVVICIADGKCALEVFFMLKSKGIENIWWFRGKHIVCVNDFFAEHCINCKDWSLNMIWQMEMHIMDACNLNCRGCTHFSPLFKQELPDFQSRINDVKKIHKKIPCIARFGILGGEPFLNPSIGDYALKIREILPNTDIYIVTNGLLLTKQDDET